MTCDVLLLGFACICPGALLSPDRRVQIIKPVIIENNTTYIVSEIDKGIRCELSIIIDFSINLMVSILSNLSILLVKKVSAHINGETSENEQIYTNGGFV